VDVQPALRASQLQTPVHLDKRLHTGDIIVTTATNNYSDLDEIALGVECKATANFGKALVKEALGVRANFPTSGTSRCRRLSTCRCMADDLGRAYWPSDHRLFYIDGKGRNHADSLGVFGIEIRPVAP
jgi:hypothetical protein